MHKPVTRNKSSIYGRLMKIKDPKKLCLYIEKCPTCYPGSPVRTCQMHFWLVPSCFKFILAKPGPNIGPNRIWYVVGMECFVWSALLLSRFFYQTIIFLRLHDANLASESSSLVLTKRKAGSRDQSNTLFFWEFFQSRSFPYCWSRRTKTLDASEF